MVSVAKHSQNHQPLPKLGMLIYPAATIHIGCLSVSGKQLPKPSEVHISILKLRLFWLMPPRQLSGQMSVYTAELNLYV